MRQLFLSRAEFWANTLQTMSHAAAEAARMAVEARKACAAMGPNGGNFFAPPGGPYGAAPQAPVDLDKLRQNLQGMDKDEADRVLYAVQMVQSMDAMRKPAAPPTPDKPQSGW